MTACLGQHCPPNLDDALLVANWPLTPFTQSISDWAHGNYSVCADGSRTFWTQQFGTLNGFGYDASGRLAIAYRIASTVTTDASGAMISSSCGHILCGASPPASPTQACYVCQLLVDPPAKGTVSLSSGQSNGPPPNCEVDENGRWVMPYLETN